MPKKSIDPGFKVSGAIGRLFDAIVDESAKVTPPGAIIRAESRENESWPAELPLTLALSHLHGDGKGSCEAAPCRLGGLCHALYEILIFQDEVGSLPRGVAIKLSQIEELRRRSWTLELWKQLQVPKRGRPRSPLLEAVYQHLVWTGGLTHLDASLLSIGPDAASPGLRRDRVRAVLKRKKKQRPANARALLPWREP